MARELIYACWGVFAVYWLAYSLTSKKTVKRQSWALTFAHRAPLGLGALLVLRPVPLFSPDPLLLPQTAALKAIGIAICAPGLFGAVWSRRTLAKNWSGDVVLKENHELIEQGPYHWVRHPIYTSILLMALGTTLASCYAVTVIGFLLLFAGIFIKSRQEERLLTTHFPTAYPAYRARTKALIPLIW